MPGSVDSLPSSAASAPGHMIQANVQHHTVLCQLEKPPKVAFDDCCDYCDIYRDGAITPLKRMEINSWRHNVNYLSQAKRAASVMSRRSQNTFSSYHYSPPGSPDVDPGFRRIKVPSNMQREIGEKRLEYDRQQGNRKARHVDVFKLTADMASVSVDYSSERMRVTPATVDDLPATWKQNWRERLTAYPGYKVEPSISASTNASNNRKEKVAKRKKGTLGSAKSSKSVGKDDKKPEYRTCSNDLLNVLSIDDYAIRHKDKGRIGDLEELGPSESSPESLAQGNHVNAYNPTSADGIPGHLDEKYKPNRKLSPSESGYNSEHEAAINNYNVSSFHLESNNMDMSYKNSQTKPKTSRRFHRMNKALHNWIETEIIIPQSDPRYFRSKSRPSTTQSLHKDSNLKLTTPVQWKAPAEESSSGAFLGMLMEMDEGHDINTNKNY